LLAHFRGGIVVARDAFVDKRPLDGTLGLKRALDESASCLATSRNVQQWEEAHTARLFVIQAVTACLINEGKDVQRDLIAPAKPDSAEHRSSLGRALARDFLDFDLPRIAEASGIASASSAASLGLSEDGKPQPDQVELIAAMLRGHPRSFSPEATVQAGAASVRELRDAIAKPWPEARAVLDRAREAQKFWSDFLAMLQMGQEEAVGMVRQLQERVRKIENPVGLALLHNERTSWSGLVQSAYVADAQEAAFSHLLGVGRGPFDPISGKAVEPLPDGTIQFTSDGKDDAYPFIKAFVSAPYDPR
jgi:hypothetical protein